MKTRPSQSRPLPARMAVSAMIGVVATAPMSAVMLYLFENLPFWERYPLPPRGIVVRMLRRLGFGRTSRAPRTELTWLAHFGFGGAMGALYPPVEHALPAAPPVKGALYGLLVWFANYAGLVPAARILPPAQDRPRRRNILMIAAHLTWGVVVGILYDVVQQAE